MEKGRNGYRKSSYTVEFKGKPTYSAFLMSKGIGIGNANLCSFKPGVFSKKKTNKKNEKNI